MLSCFLSAPSGLDRPEGWARTSRVAATVLLALGMMAVGIPTATGQSSTSSSTSTASAPSVSSGRPSVSDNRFVYSATATDGRAGAASSYRSVGQDTMRIDFDEAIQIALDQNTDLKRASNQVRSADASILAERMDFFPTASISTGGQRTFGRSFSPQEGEVINASNDFLTFDGSSNLTLFNGFENFASLNRAQAEGRAEDLSLGRTRQDVVFQVMNRYLQLVENREVLRVQEEELAAREQQLAQIREFVDAGSRPVSALYEQQAAVAEQESAVLTAERDVALSETRLLQVLQLDPTQPYRFESPSVGEDSLQVEEYDLDLLLNRAMDRRLDLRAAQAQTDAAESGIRAAKSGYYPTVSLSFSYGTDWSSRIGDFQVVPETRVFDVPTEQGVTIQEERVVDVQRQPLNFFDKLDQRRGGSVSIQLSYSLFDGFRRNERVEQAQVQAQNAQYNLEDQRLQVTLEVREAYLNYRNAAQQLDASQKRLRAARQALEAGDKIKVKYMFGSSVSDTSESPAQVWPLAGKVAFAEPVAYKDGAKWSYGRVAQTDKDKTWVITGSGHVKRVDTSSVKPLEINTIYKKGDSVWAVWVGGFKPAKVTEVVDDGVAYKVKYDEGSEEEKTVGFGKVTKPIE